MWSFFIADEQRHGKCGDTTRARLVTTTVECGTQGATTPPGAALITRPVRDPRRLSRTLTPRTTRHGELGRPVERICAINIDKTSTDNRRGLVTGNRTHCQRWDERRKQPLWIDVIRRMHFLSPGRSGNVTSRMPISIKNKLKYSF